MGWGDCHCVVCGWDPLPCIFLISYTKLIWKLDYSTLLDHNYVEDKHIHFLMSRWVQPGRLYREQTQNP